MCIVMGIALISDQHFGTNQFCVAQHNAFALFYEEIFFPTLEQRRIKSVFDLGDTFDRRAVADDDLISWAKKNYFDKLLSLDIVLYVLRGNHNPKRSCDGRSIDAITSIANEYSNIILIDDPKILSVKDKKILMAPYLDHKACLVANKSNSQAQRQKQYFSAFRSAKVDLILTHLAFRGHKIYEKKNTSGGFNPYSSNFKDINTPIISGHYHPRSTSSSPDISYLGAPYALKRFEFNVSRGFHILDVNSLNLEYIENNFQAFNYELVDTVDSFLGQFPDLSNNPNEYLYVIPKLSPDCDVSGINYVDSNMKSEFIEFVDTTEKLQSLVQVLITRKEYLIARKILEHAAGTVEAHSNLYLHYAFVLMGINSPEANKKAIDCFNYIIAWDVHTNKSSSDSGTEIFSLIQTLAFKLHENSLY